MARMRYVACFRAARVEGLTADIQEQGFRVVCHHGTAETHRMEAIGGGFRCPEDGRYIVPAGDAQIAYHVGELTLPEDDYVYLSCFVDAENSGQARTAGRERVIALRSALRVVLGRQVVDCRMFEEVWTSDHEKEGFGETIRLDGPIPVRRFGEDDVAQLRAALGRLSPLDTPPDPYLDLAIRWYEHAQHHESELDQFLACWFALESYPLRGSKRLGKLKSLVDEILGTGASTSSVPIGRMYELRGRIVHEGVRHFSPAERRWPELILRLTHEVARSGLGLPPAGYLESFLS